MNSHQTTLNSRLQKQGISQSLAEVFKKIMAMFRSEKHEAGSKLKNSGFTGAALQGAMNFPVPPEAVAAQLHEVKKAIHKIQNDATLSKRRKLRIVERLRRQVMRLVNKDDGVYGSGFGIKRDFR